MQFAPCYTQKNQFNSGTSHVSYHYLITSIIHLFLILLFIRQLFSYFLSFLFPFLHEGVIPKSTNPQHIQDNMAAISVTLSDSRMGTLMSLDKQHHYCWDPAQVAQSILFLFSLLNFSFLFLFFVLPPFFFCLIFFSLF